MALLREKYSDFGPTLAAEKLSERHNIRVSVETLRKWMTADGLWVPHSRRKPRVYQPRYRRDCLGELVQIDGSHHDCHGLFLGKETVRRIMISAGLCTPEITGCKDPSASLPSTLYR